MNARCLCLNLFPTKLKIGEEKIILHRKLPPPISPHNNTPEQAVSENHKKVCTLGDFACHVGGNGGGVNCATTMLLLPLPSSFTWPLLAYGGDEDAVRSRVVNFLVSYLFTGCRTLLGGYLSAAHRCLVIDWQ